MGRNLQYPICLNLAGHKCLVVGGGAVAERKVEGLLPCGADVTVVSPQVTDRILGWAAEGRLAWRARPFEAADIVGVFLVISAAAEQAVNRTVAAAAGRLGIPANVADDPDLCQFTLPAVLRRGSLCVAVSTGGKSPAVARMVRDRLEGCLGEDDGVLLDLVAEERARLRATVPDALKRRAALGRLLAGDLPRLVREGNQEMIRECIERWRSSLSV